MWLIRDMMKDYRDSHPLKGNEEFKAHPKGTMGA
jgi:hypothetical protein